MIQNDLKDIFDDSKILGVHFRGTDYKAGYQNHPVAVQIEQTIAQVKKCLEKNAFQKIFLATDEKSAVERFEKEFPGKVFYFRMFTGERAILRLLSASQIVRTITIALDMKYCGICMPWHSATDLLPDYPRLLTAPEL